jgi:hypothetical protein
MIELLGTTGYETISAPNRNSTMVIRTLLSSGVAAPVVAEIGVGIGATTLAMATLLDNRGELHIYDFQDKVAALIADLEARGYTNVRAFGNSGRHWDSYTWTLGQKILNGCEAVYDYIYVDGPTRLPSMVWRSCCATGCSSPAGTLNSMIIPGLLQGRAGCRTIAASS